MIARGATARQVEIRAAVDRHGGHQARAAAELGISRPSVTAALHRLESHLLPGSPRVARIRERFDSEAFSANLAREVDKLTPDDLANGAVWWKLAVLDVAWLASHYGVPYERVAYATAAVSPGLRWRATVDIVQMLLDARAAGAEMPSDRGHMTFGLRDRRKAWRILAGDDAKALCRGPKVEAMAANLLGDLSAVCVDRHIIRAATGSDRRQVSPATSRKIADALRLLAGIRGVAPAELQAALWVARAKS